MTHIHKIKHDKSCFLIGKVKFIIINNLFILCIVLSFISWPTEAKTKVKQAISWTPKSINESINQGQIKNISVSFSSRKKIATKSYTIVASEEINTFVKVDAQIPNFVKKNKQIHSEININIPVNAVTGAYHGSLKLVRIGKRGQIRNVFLNSLPMIININKLEPATSSNTAITPEPLAGFDSDTNGIRDDIDRIIDGYPLSEDQKDAAKRFAKSLQTTLLTTSSKDNAYDNAINSARAQKCMASKITDYSKYSNQLHAFTFNTEERVQAYIAYEELIGGSVFPEVQGQACE
jgi:hypothetical protein